MDKAEFNILHTQGPEGGEIFGPWFESYGKILGAKRRDGSNVDTWKEGTSYFVYLHNLREDSIFRVFAKAAAAGTVANIFDNRESFKIERLFVPFVMQEEKMISVNRIIQDLKANNLSGVVNVPLGISMVPLMDPNKYQGRFLSTSIPYRDMQIIASNNSLQLSEAPTIVFFPVWRISFVVNGSSQSALLMEYGDKVVYNFTKFPLDDKMSQPTSVNSNFFESLFSALTTILCLIVILTSRMHNFFDTIFIIIFFMAVSTILIYAFSFIGLCIDKLVNKVRESKQRAEWKAYYEANLNHKAQTLRDKFGIIME